MAAKKVKAAKRGALPIERDVAAKLEGLIAALGASQDGFAQAIQMSPSTVSRVLDGQRGGARIILAAQVNLGVDVAYWSVPTANPADFVADIGAARAACRVNPEGKVPQDSPVADNSGVVRDGVDIRPERLRQLITWSDLTHNKFADRLGVSRALVSRVLNGSRGVHAKIVLGALRAYGLREDYWTAGGAPDDFVAPDLSTHVAREAAAVGIDGDDPRAAVTSMRQAIERLRAVVEGRP